MGLLAFLSTQVIDTTSVGRSVMTAADAAAARTAIGAGTSSFDGAFGSLSGVPTTISGYGITNAYTKTEVDNLVAGLLDFKGNQDCSANPNYPSALKGDAYYVSVAGKIGGASGITVAVGDLIVCAADNAGGTQASVGSSWFVLEKNLDGALVSSNNLSDLTSASTARTNLGLGTLATQSGTFSGTSSGTNTGDQTITLTGDVTGSGTGSFATTIANSAVTNAMLAGSIAISKLAITGTPDGTKFLRDDGTWAAASGGGGGITSLGGQTGATQTFLAATTGTDFAISSSGDVHTFAIPDASASARGLVTTGTQTIAGAKTFSGNVTFSGGTIAGASDVLTLVNSTSAQTLNIANTFTSSTSFEYGRCQWASNEFRIGTAVGSAGGTQRNLVLGGWNSAGTWTPKITVNPAGNVAMNCGGWTWVYSGANTGLYTASYTASGGKIVFGDSSGVLGSSASGSNFFMDYVGWSGHQFTVSANTAAPRPFLFTDGTFNPLTASTEMTSVNWNLATTKTFAAGAITTQRAFRIQAPTYAFASASTITTAVTFDISGAPIAGTNATITTRLGARIGGGALIGTATSDLIGFWNATPIVQPTTGVASATRTGGGGTALTDTDTYDGYTIAQVVKALRNLGVLA